MNEEFRKNLIDKYPKLFDSQYHYTIETNGNGWNTLIDMLCRHIQYYCDYRKDVEQVKVLQIKEKFGELRFYVQNSNDYVDGFISCAELYSKHLCEECGDYVEHSSMNGSWISTLCSKHISQ